jgi:hypothetical protein
VHRMKQRIEREAKEDAADQDAANSTPSIEWKSLRRVL